MNRILKPIQATLVLLILVALNSCTLGQVMNPPTPTVDIGAVQTSAAATAFVELTTIAGKASATVPPTQTATTAPATETPDATQVANATQSPAPLSPTASETAGGLPAVETPLATPIAGTPGAVPSLTPFTLVAPTSSGPTCLNSQFMGDITIPDGTVMAPFEKFTKIWEVKNTGLCAWDEGFGVVLIAGPDMRGGPQYLSTHDQRVEPGGTWDIVVEMRAPTEPGDYVAHWKMISDTGQFFGTDLVVYIKVVR